MHAGDGHSSKSELVELSSAELAKLAEPSSKLCPDHTSIVKSTIFPRSIKRRLSPEVREAIVMRHKTGETVKALSEEFSISESGLRDLLIVEDMAIRKPPMTPRM